MLEIGPVGIEVVRFEIAIARRMRIQAVISQDDGLRVLEFRENLRFKDKVTLHVVPLARREGRLVRGCASGEHAYARILSVFRETVVDLQLFLFPAKFAGGAGAEVIRERQKDLR